MGAVYEEDYRIPGFLGDRFGRAGLANMMSHVGSVGTPIGTVACGH